MDPVVKEYAAAAQAYDTKLSLSIEATTAHCKISWLWGAMTAMAGKVGKAIG